MKHWILGISLVGMLSACSKDGPDSTVPTPDIPNTGNEGVEVRFSSGVVVSTEVQSPFSRTIFEDYIPEGSQIGIYGIAANLTDENQTTAYSLVQGRGNYWNPLENALYTVESSIDGSMKADGETAKFPNDTEGNGLVFYGYYPYTSDIYAKRGASGVEALGLLMSLNSTNMENTTDYLYTGQIPKITNNWIGKPVELNFKHTLSRIQFQFVNDTKNTTISVNAIDITGTGYTSGYMNLEDGSFITSANNTKRSRTYTYEAGNELIGENGLNIDFLLFENTEIETITFYISINGVFQEEPTPSYDVANGSDVIQLKRGVKNVVKVTYKSKDANLAGRIDMWEEKTAMDYTQEIEETPANE